MLPQLCRVALSRNICSQKAASITPTSTSQEYLFSKGCFNYAEFYFSEIFILHRLLQLCRLPFTRNICSQKAASIMQTSTSQEYLFSKGCFNYVDLYTSQEKYKLHCSSFHPNVPSWSVNCSKWINNTNAFNLKYDIHIYWTTLYSIAADAFTTISKVAWRNLLTVDSTNVQPIMKYKFLKVVRLKLLHSTWQPQ